MDDIVNYIDNLVHKDRKSPASLVNLVNKNRLNLLNLGITNKNDTVNFINIKRYKRGNARISWLARPSVLFLRVNSTKNNKKGDKNE